MRKFVKKHKGAFILAAIILAQLIYITYQFAFVKEGFHPDDGWSYLFANGNYQTWIYKDENENLINCNQWIDSKLFREFLMVDEGMEFQYDAVLYNMSDERNPPLHSLLLHTICSFFPETFSWWYAYALNVLCFIFTMIALYFLGRELTRSKKLALSICAFYGFTTGALNTYMFLRSYALLTGLAVMLCYLHCRMYRKGFKHVFPQLGALLLVMVLGNLNQYTFLMLGLCFTIVFGVYTLCAGKWKFSLIYGMTMALSVVITILLWPRTLTLFLERNEMYYAQMPLWWEIKYCVLLWTRESTGVPFRFPSIVFWTWMETILIYVVMFAAAVGFLLRKETRFQKIIKKLLKGGCRFVKSLPEKIRHLNKCYLLLFVICGATLVIIAKLCDIYNMNIYSDRYLFFLMPILTAITAGALYWLLGKLIKRKRVTSILFAIALIAGLVSNHIVAPSNYIYKRDCDKMPIDELVKDANVIIAVKENWNLSYYAPLLRDSKKFYMVNLADCMEALDSLNQLEDDGKTPVYLVAETAVMRSEDWVRDGRLSESTLTMDEKLTYDFTISDLVNEYAKAEWATKKEHVQDEVSFFGSMSVWRLR